MEGDVPGAVAQFREVLAEAEAARAMFLAPACLHGLGSALAYAGELDEARAAARAAIAAETDFGGSMQGIGHSALTIVQLAAGDAGAALTASETAWQQMSPQVILAAGQRVRSAEAARPWAIRKRRVPGPKSDLGHRRLALANGLTVRAGVSLARAARATPNVMSNGHLPASPNPERIWQVPDALDSWPPPSAIGVPMARRCGCWARPRRSGAAEGWCDSWLTRQTTQPCWKGCGKRCRPTSSSPPGPRAR